MESFYDVLGGESTVRAITQTFYRIMDTKEDYQELREMHPADISISEQKLFMFLSGWLGGPKLFEEAYGHPRLRARHLPFKIGKKERDQWVLCMVEAFDECQIAEPHRSQLLHSLLRLADHMRNIPEEE
ncbi:MAG: group II truncated hemoglobin [Bdellovibrionia bacterium]